MCSLQCRSPVLLPGQDNAVWEGSKTPSQLVIQILHKPCCSCRSVVPFILHLSISVSAHTKVLSAPAGCKGMRWTGLEVSVTQHKAIAAGGKHKGKFMAVLCCWQLPPQLAGAEGEVDKIYQVEPVASVISFCCVTFPGCGGADKAKLSHAEAYFYYCLLLACAPVLC